MYDGPRLLTDYEHHLEDNRELLSDWFNKKRANLPSPLYGSVDIRDAGWKVAAVDVNAFPAGFNNIQKDDLSRLTGPMRYWMDNQYPDAELILLWPESNTRNPGYAENILTLLQLIRSTGRECLVGSIDLTDVTALEAISGVVDLNVVKETSDGVMVDNRRPDLIITNNDLTNGEIPSGSIPVEPPQRIGWFKRRKSDHFRAVQPLIDEVAKILDIDPWMLGTHWFVSEEKCLREEKCRIALARDVDNCLDHLREKYSQYGIEAEPRLFVKNDSGTYGLGIIEINSGNELLNLSKRKINRLTYGKGGVDAENFLIQEGVPTRLRFGDSVIEPCMYSIGGDVDAWFYRVNAKKGELSNLNTPSTVFMTPSDISNDPKGKEAIRHGSGWHALIAELAMLGLAVEYSLLK